MGLPSLPTRTLLFLIGTVSLQSVPLRVQALRKITIDNQCSGTIYPAFQGQGGSPTATDGSAQAAGWEQQPGTYEFSVPDNWNTARLWARTGCTSSGSSLECVIGGCSGGLECSGSETGRAGATLAEFTLNSTGSDSYDVSIVDGFNLPMEIVPSDPSCETGSCGTETDILTECDSRLVYPQGSDKIYSCASPCLNAIQLQGGTSGEVVAADAENTLVCCVMGNKAVRHEDCPNTYQPFYQARKSMCKKGYVYADDDMYDGAVYSCGGAGLPGYTIRFCPNGLGSGVSPPDVSNAKTESTDAGDNSGNLLSGPSTVAAYSVVLVSGSTEAGASATGASGVGSAASVATTAASSGSAATSIWGGTSSGTQGVSSVSTQAANTAITSAAAATATATSTSVTNWNGNGASYTGGEGHQHHTGAGGVGAIAIASSLSASASATSDGSLVNTINALPETTTFTSAGKVYVEVIEKTVLVARDGVATPSLTLDLEAETETETTTAQAVTTGSASREVGGLGQRDVGVGCLKGRWLGEGGDCAF